VRTAGAKTARHSTFHAAHLARPNTRGTASAIFPKSPYPRLQEFNAKTADFKEGTLLRVKMRVYSDKTYEWDLKMPPSTWLIKKAAGERHCPSAAGGLVPEGHQALPASVVGLLLADPWPASTPQP
jgi:hypothetical protein